MTQSLRGRLLIGVISLVVLGLLISSAVTYLTMQHFLLQRLDDQLWSRAGKEVANGSQTAGSADTETHAAASNIGGLRP